MGCYTPTRGTGYYTKWVIKKLFLSQECIIYTKLAQECKQNSAILDHISMVISDSYAGGFIYTGMKIKRGSSLLLSRSHTPPQGRGKRCHRQVHHKFCLSWGGPAGSWGWHSPEIYSADPDCNHWTALGRLRHLSYDKQHRDKFACKNVHTHTR